MRSHDVIVLCILPEWTKISFLVQLTAVSWKWWVSHYLLKNVSFKKCSDDLNYAGYSSYLRKYILWLVKSKLLTLNISWFTPYPLPRTCIIDSDFLYFLKSWNNKLLCLHAWKLSNNNKIKYSNIIFIHSY